MNQNTKRNYRYIRRLSLASLITVYFLILVGGIVRSTGSGMGCPDWPKCFGQWVPPTDKSQLPENYKEIYSEKRDKKNKKFAKYLSFLGFENKAKALLMDKSVLEEEDFNKYKTWTEYINRLVGVLVGFFILLTFVSSVPLAGTRMKLLVLALLTLSVTVLQGWIGSVVVSTNLLQWMVTIHMLLALLVVALLINLVFITFDVAGASTTMAKVPATVNVVLSISMLLMLIQIVLGTQVREALNQVAVSLAREEWVEAIGTDFVIHRSFSWLIAGSNLLLYYLLGKGHLRIGIIKHIVEVLLAIIGMTVLSGVVMAYFGIPPFAQPIHLLAATLIFGLQFLLFLVLNFRNKVALTTVS